eukprot:CAMPEP_0172823514 /NCGR_PEP_ID=MMETSP1075-20121228/17386_1 /TAXON_ID=2916 /ORGANISM="Ceratium fusus, Strain PA161109" /LENGTH=276 /DNA_ID=CAMNT_0013664665 /DNA_START=17 /DNA_END=847 /DNA_ORIENTATION=-
MAPSRPVPLPFGRGKPEARTITFVVGGESVPLPRLFLTIHSETWAGKLAADPQLHSVELEGDSGSFRSFAQFLQGAHGDAGEVTSQNVRSLLHWGEELDVDYIAGECESFFLTSSDMEPCEVLELAARYNLPLAYARAAEAAGVSAQRIDADHELFEAHDIREDVLRSHLGRGLDFIDAEQRLRHRFADHTGMTDAKQRARLTWKKSRRLPIAFPEPEARDWKQLQTVFPHHSMRGADWTVVPDQTQPSHPLRTRGFSAKSEAMMAKTGYGFGGQY